MRTLWIKSLLAAVPAALFLAAPAPMAHAGETCTALASPDTVDAYNACLDKMGIRCKSAGSILDVYTHTVTCPYSDGGRDECAVHSVPFTGGREFDSVACTYVPPGAESAPAPAPGAAPEPAPAGEPS